MNDRSTHPEQEPLPFRPHRTKFFRVTDVSKGATEHLPAGKTNGLHQHIEQPGASLAQSEQKKFTSGLYVLASPLNSVEVQKENLPAAHGRVWKPGTLGFGNNEDTGETDGEIAVTMPMMILTAATSRQEPQATSMKSQVSGAAGNAGLVGVGNIAGSILKYGGNFLIQYGLGAGLYGVYTLSLSVVNLVSAIFSLGLDDAMMRYGAIYRGKQQPRLLQGLILFCTLIAGIVGILGALLLLFFTPSIVAFWTALRPGQAVSNRETLKQMTPLLQMLVPLIPLLVMQVIWYGGLRGFKAFKWRVLTTSILQPALQIGLSLIVLVVFRNLVGFALVMLLSTAFGTAMNLFFLFKEYTRVATAEREQYEFREWFTFSTLNFLTTIIDTVLDSIDTLLLAFYGIPKVGLGQYGAALKLGPFIAMPLLSLNTVFAPMIAELHSKGELEALESMFKVVTKWTITFSLPIFLIVSLFSPYLMALSGASFIGAWPLVIGLSVGNMLGAATGAVGAMLLMTGHNKLSFLNSLTAIIVNVILGIILTPRFGAMGTAISTGLALCVLNIMRLLQVRIILKMQPYRWDSLKPVGAGLISSALTGGLLLLFNASHIRASIVLGHAILSAQLGLIPVFVASYIGLIILFGIDPEDEIVLKALRKKFRRGKNKKNRIKRSIINMRSVIFGIDGLTFSVLHPLIERGKLPNFQKLALEGCEAILESKYPPLTPPAWTSLSTGVKPARHGIYDFWSYEGKHVRGSTRQVHVLTRRRGEKAIWNILSEYGKQVLVINVPATYPPETVNGIMVSGYMTPSISTEFTYPTSFKEEIFRVAPNYQIDLEVHAYERLKQSGKVGPIVDAILRMTEQRIKLIMHMLKEKPWDFCYLAFIGADRLQHPLWEEVISLDPRTNEYYQMIDDALGQVLELLGPDDSPLRCLRSWLSRTQHLLRYQ